MIAAAVRVTIILATFTFLVAFAIGIACGVMGVSPYWAMIVNLPLGFYVGNRGVRWFMDHEAGR